MFSITRIAADTDQLDTVHDVSNVQSVIANDQFGPREDL